jgi:hypothetical protein
MVFRPQRETRATISSGMAVPPTATKRPLCSLDPLRRPRSHRHRDQRQTNIRVGPLEGGRSIIPCGLPEAHVDCEKRGWGLAWIATTTDGRGLPSTDGRSRRSADRASTDTRHSTDTGGRRGGRSSRRRSSMAAGNKAVRSRQTAEVEDAAHDHQAGRDLNQRQTQRLPRARARRMRLVHI